MMGRMIELERLTGPAEHGETAYAADFYRVDGAIEKRDLEYLAELPSFEVLLIKGKKSRRLDMCPERETGPMTLSDDAASYLAQLGVRRLVVDEESVRDERGRFKQQYLTSLKGVEPGFYTCRIGEKLWLGEPIRGAIPLGVRRDGSLYTRIQWASTTEKNPYYWVCNLIDDDVERHGGTWGANTMGPANAILDFFGESETIRMIRIFHNVGSTISLEEEMAEQIRIYVSDDERCSRFGTHEAEIDCVEWQKILDVHMEMKEQWNTYILKQPVTARYLRLELVKNFGTPEDVPWTETAELKLF